MPDFELQVAGLVSWSQDVRAAMRRMDPTQSRVLRMIYFERRTAAQVADELQLSTGAVTRMLSLGMQALGMALLASAAD